MKHLEEKILAYLDGSLTTSEREELLHTISASPEGRRMLDAHLRMNSLITHAAKPVSAPLETQRALASKIPMMAVKLPYLAPPVQQRRSAALFGMPGKYVAAVVGGLALVGGALWYATSSSNNNTTNNNAPISASSESRSLPLAQSNQSQQETQSNAGTNSQVKTDAVPSTHSPTIANAATENAARVHTATATSHINDRIVASTDRHAAQSASRTSSNSRATQSSLPIKASEMPNTIPEEHAALNQQAANANPENDNNVSSLHAAPIAADSHAQANSHYDIPRFLAEHYSPNYVPLRFFANFKARSAMLPPAAWSKHTAESNIGVINQSETKNGYEVGIDYEITPWTSVGIRGGQSYFYQLKPYRYKENHGELDEWVNDTKGNRVLGNWAGLAMRYEFNPEDKLRVAASAVAGVAFVEGLSPLGMVELSTTYSLFNFLALEAAASVDGASVAHAAEEAPPNTRSTAGFVTRGPNRDDLFTTALGVRLGLVFHP